MTEPDADACRPVEIDGEIIRVRGSSDMSDESQAALTEVIRAAKRKFAAEHPARLTVDTITSDQLDALQDRVEFFEAALARMRDRKEVADVRVRRALDVIHEWQRNGPPNDYLTRVHRALNPPVSGNSSAALDEPKEPTPEKTRAPEVVAYRSRDGRLLRCLQHAPPPDLIGTDFLPVTSDDLEDGGICTYPRCGVDVLIADEQPAEPFREPSAEADRE